MTIYLRIPNLHAQHDKGKAFRYVFVGPEGTWSFAFDRRRQGFGGGSNS